MFANKTKKAFIRSLFEVESKQNSMQEIYAWIEEKKTHAIYSVQQILFIKMEDWSLERSTGSIRHKLNAFFSVIGIKIETDFQNKRSWEQVIIKQAEIGILGILVKEIDGILYFLMQLKFEPGNIGGFQISPTFQATKSNYSQVHKGKLPDYASFFLENITTSNVIFDQLQSEQNSRFLKKKNRNLIIEIRQEIELKENFKWLTLYQICELLKENNLVNMDSRSVLACLPIPELIDFKKENTFIELLTQKAVFKENSIENILLHLENLRNKYSFKIEEKSILRLANWDLKEEKINHESNRFFDVIAVKVKADSREILEWNQPLLKAKNIGLNCFILKKISGVYHFLLQAKMEIGCEHKFEYGPTIQESELNKIIPFFDLISEKESRILIDTKQSEEGGRFFQEENRNLIIEIQEKKDLELPENYIWATYSQIHKLLKEKSTINMQARSLISLIPCIK